MNTLPCGHVAHSSGRRACIHLLDESNDPVDRVKVLSGRGLAYDTVCADCHAARAGGLVELCVGCHQRVDEDCTGDLVPWRGKPEIRDRREAVDQHVSIAALPDGVRDIAAAGDGWLALTGRGTLVRSEGGGWAEAAHLRLPRRSRKLAWNDIEPRPRLHASPCGDFAAVVTDHGRTGQVVDLRTGAVTLSLDGGTYHFDTVPFSLAFTEHAGRAVVLHRSAWNRVDASDPATGALLITAAHTERDLFHGALHLSPGGRWAASDGWVWHPIGVPTAWELATWLDSGGSHDPSTALCGRWYLWNVPMCWIDDTRLAVWGIGEDAEAMLDGVRIFDAATGAETLAFAGPGRHPLHSDGVRLYSAAPTGLELWDPATGERTGCVPGFVPSAHHPRRGEFASVTGGVLRTWRAAT